MIYELFGLPGSGKTTYCKNIYKTEQIRNIMHFYREIFFGKLIFHFYLKCISLFKKDYRLYNKIINEIGDCNYINKIDKKIKINTYIKYLLFVNKIEKKHMKKNTNLLVDEGVIHYCMAMIAEFSLSYENAEKILKIIKFENNRVIPIGLQCSVDKCLEHIEKRNRKNTPIDFLEKESLRNVLTNYEKSYNYFKNKYNEI